MTVIDPAGPGRGRFIRACSPALRAARVGVSERALEGRSLRRALPLPLLILENERGQKENYGHHSREQLKSSPDDQNGAEKKGVYHQFEAARAVISFTITHLKSDIMI